MAEKLKDIFFRRPFYNDLILALEEAYPGFRGDEFLDRVFDDEWEERALKERVRHTTLSIRDLLPLDYRQALQILRNVAPRMKIYGFENMLFPDFVEVYGLKEWEASIAALEEFTQLMSAEFAVRPFIKQDQTRMMAQMLAWTDHESDAVRRLASEGCRPRLPWGMALHELQADPAPILPILEVLKDDESEAVQRSVANNLNDISKDNPEIVLRVLQGWQSESDAEMQLLINHALRTLVKMGHPGALDLLGYSPEPAIQVEALKLEPVQLRIGENLYFSFEIHSFAEIPQKLMIDYVVYLMRASGKQTQKVFKLAKREIDAGECIRIKKKHSFAPVTTRKYYPGEHAIEVQVNGKRYGHVEFELMAEGD